MKSLLITGISGFLGWHVARLLQTDWQIIGTYNEHEVTIPNGLSIQLDIRVPSEIGLVINELEPDAVLHLAAISNTTFCELKPEESALVNVEATQNLAYYCQQKNIPFVFASTDMVFDGGHAPYSEDDLTFPVNTYGRQKAAAEQAILEVYPNACIARLPLLYGIAEQASNFFSSWLQSLREGRNVSVFQDEIRTPISGRDAAKGLLLLINQQAQGVFHLGGKERISRYDFTRKMCEAFAIPLSQITPVTHQDLNLLARRPKDVSFNSEKAYALGFDPNSIESELKALAASNLGLSTQQGVGAKASANTKTFKK